eukprot:gnl/MRDRNA2_/MRDRNA2_27983_c0_seq2.p1 gnl/MRDRNA2_/MRDRNA2_27983_c0~~gnl/MRDRNA2_/MRDRNA2_27983_c0_seq2.p1  ORF type:complete len:112 (+),score=18.01 gnl/MRDRNA2_/MRDRNA2_27983_c0_seq2:108-443(+)
MLSALKVSNSSKHVATQVMMRALHVTSVSHSSCMKNTSKPQHNTMPPHNTSKPPLSESEMKRLKRDKCNSSIDGPFSGGIYNKAWSSMDEINKRLLCGKAPKSKQGVTGSH